MLHAEHILCLVGPASAAPPQALFLARHLGAPLHVVPHPSVRTVGEGEEQRVDPVAFSSEVGEQVPVRCPEPPPTSMSGVLRYVVDASIDLVVADAPSERGPVPPLAIGPAQVLVTNLSCPAFFVECVGAPETIRRIVVPINLSDHGLRAFRYALNLARLYDASVHVLHVVDSLPYVALTPTDRLSFGTRPLSEHRGRRRVRAFLPEEEADDVTVHIQLAYGDDAEQIIHVAGQNETDLMVLSSHGSEERSRAPLGRVARRVLGRVTCPLVLTRAFGTSLLAPDAASEGLADGT